MNIWELFKTAAPVITVSGVGIGIYKKYKNWKSNKESDEDLSIFFGDNSKVEEYTKIYIRTQCVDRPPDDEEDYRRTDDYANKEDLINFFIRKEFRKPGKNAFLILADAGMGKTTFMINLFKIYSSKIFKKKYKIKFIPLGDPQSDFFIEELKKQGMLAISKMILLLDAFDEDPKALENYSLRLTEIITNTRGFAKVIITSRTQFFPEEDKEKFSGFIPLNGKEINQLTVGKKYIAPFSDKEVQLFLRKKYSFKLKLGNGYYYSNFKRKLAEEVCKKATNLIARPMLLDNIDLIIESNEVHNFEYEIYNTLIDSWIKRESLKQMQKHSNNHEFVKEMKLFVEKAALICYRNFRDGKGIFIDSEELKEVASELSIKLDIIDLSTRSLLNRNSKGRFKFSHKTVLEFLLAKYDIEQIQKNKFINFQSFDFGLYIRNQLCLLPAVGIFRPVYISIDGYLFTKFKVESLELINKISEIILVNHTPIAARKFHSLSGLKKIYFLTVDPSTEYVHHTLDDNMQDIIKDNVHKLVINGSQLGIKSKNRERSTKTILVEPVNDEFFKSISINLYNIYVYGNI